ncbi:MAG TPA: hypothetical protein PKA19_13650 [Bacillota bacterium]|nr:hypothetical protein [Bacillota bacterium]
MDLDVTVLQDGKIMSETDPIDSTKDINVGVSFRVPVRGDYVVGNDVNIVTEADTVWKGDVAYLELSNAFKTVPSGTYDLNYKDPSTHQNLLVGTAQFIPSGGAVWAKIEFKGADEVFDGLSHGDVAQTHIIM